ncbi:Predicted membrane protein [Staphylococcus piscifermentans]|nr:Predicted membrane protein [Staphylococcus piscifermentans]
MTVPICFIVATISYNFINPMVRTDAQHHGVLWIFVVLFLLIYVALAVYIFVITLLPSQPEDNKYGRGPAGKKFEQGHAPTSHKSYSESATGSHHTHYE